MSNLKILFNDRNIYVKSRFIPLLLDLYAGAGVAYSLRKLKSTTVNVARVRRSSDNAEQDFRASEVTNGILTTFCGASDGFVTTWYDQSGNAKNMVTTLASRQTQIVSLGSLILLNGKPVLKRINTTNGMLSNYSPNDGAANKSMYLVSKNPSSTSALFSSNAGTGDYGYIAQQSSTTTTVNNTTLSLSNEKLNNNALTYLNRGDFYTKTQNQFLLSNNIVFSFVDNVLGLGYRFSNSSGVSMNDMQEFIIFENQLNNSAITTNINNYYTIY